jgi:L-lactate dehydrogenase (cytochrome)
MPTKPSAWMLEDLEEMARRRLPASIFTHVAGGSDSLNSLRANRDAFAQLAFRHNLMVDVSARSPRTDLFGHTYNAPFGIAPMGGAALCRRQGDLLLARAAAAGGIPFLLSGASSMPLEAVRQDTQCHWFQAYLSADHARIAALLKRVGTAGYETLVVTLDMTLLPNRVDCVKAGFTMPPTMNAQLVADGMMRPRWLFETLLPTLLKDGIPYFENYDAERGGRLIQAPTGAPPSRSRAAMTWEHVRHIRSLWPGKLVVKGILSPGDAARSIEAGADGIIVSNHGGRQLDCALAPLRALPDIVAVAGGRPVMLDGGVRSGTDVVKALCLGARFVFVGRPMMYALALGGEAGVREAITTLTREVDRVSGLLGCTSPAELRPELLTERDRPLLTQGIGGVAGGHAAYS